MKTTLAAVFVLASALPAFAEESLLEMLKKPSSPALAAVLADAAPALGSLDTEAGPAEARGRATRDIRVEPGSITTVRISRGRDVSLPGYANRR